MFARTFPNARRIRPQPRFQRWEYRRPMIGSLRSGGGSSHAPNRALKRFDAAEIGFDLRQLRISQRARVDLRSPSQHWLGGLYGPSEGCISGSAWGYGYGGVIGHPAASALGTRFMHATLPQPT